MTTAEVLRAEIARLEKIIRVLVDRAERSTDLQGTDFNLFQAAIMLDEQVKARTGELEAALRDNERITRALRESEAKYHALVDQSLVGIVIIDGGRFGFANPRFREIFGYSAEELAALDPVDVAIEEDRPLVAEQIRKRQAGEADRVHYQFRGRCKNGKPLDIEAYGNATEIGGRRVFVSVVQDVTERRRAEREVLALQEQLREQSLRDPLTGLYNRRYLEETLARELLRAERQQRPISLIMGDLDHFKEVNDRHGHPAGDQVLRAFAALLKRNARRSDVNCRFGGEEFLLVLPGMSKGEAAERAGQLCQSIAASPVACHGESIAVTASFGVAAYPGDGQTAEELVAAADAALYAAKAAGRNRVVVR